MITADTNVLIYLWDNADPEKLAAAQAIVAGLARTESPLALQVIGEAQNVMRRKLGQPPWQAAQNARNLLTAFDIFVATESNAAESLSLMAAGRMSYWDAMLVTAARDAGCDVLLSEDMQHGGQLGRLSIVNPFSTDPASLRALAQLGASP
jgi:predicted nucleic acid-binding protein